MTEQEFKLLSNLFDCFDHISDKESNVIDLHELMYATNLAIDSDFGLELDNQLDELKSVATSSLSPESQINAALNVTDKLRGTLNDLLPM